jgi:hypothetical protein
MKYVFIVLTVVLAFWIVNLKVRESWTNMQWEQTMYGMATAAGTMEAGDDYRNGVLRVFELAADSTTEDTGSKDGPFEVWTWAYFPSMGHPQVYAAERFVEMYDQRMRYMYAHPEKFKLSGGATRATSGGSD